MNGYQCDQCKEFIAFGREGNRPQIVLNRSGLREEHFCSSDCFETFVKQDADDRRERSREFREILKKAKAAECRSTSQPA